MYLVNTIPLVWFANFYQKLLRYATYNQQPCVNTNHFVQIDRCIIINDKMCDLFTKIKCCVVGGAAPTVLTTVRFCAAQPFVYSYNIRFTYIRRVRCDYVRCLFIKTSRFTNRDIIYLDAISGCAAWYSGKRRTLLDGTPDNL